MTRDEIMAEVSYDPETGMFTRLRPVPGGRVGLLKLKPHSVSGYVQIKIRGRNFSAHRLAWLLTYGVWPPSDIDHRNRNRSDNRLCNLRLATDSQNRANAKVGKHSRTAIKGVTYRSRYQKYQAYITRNGRTHSLGYFLTADEAAVAYARAAAELFGEFAAPLRAGE